jgi:superfamily II DNA helicase RecQ
MSRRRRRAPIHVTLVLPAEAPTQDEIDAVLMATDSILGEAGRTGVTLILNGSRSKKALEWEWDQLDDYGRLQHLTADQIGRKVDGCIHYGWLRIEYDRHIPLLYHTARGWKRVWPRLETINREIKFLVLDKIAEEARADLVPLLRAWFPHEIRAVRTAINRTLQALGQRGLRHPQHPKRQSS